MEKAGKGDRHGLTIEEIQNTLRSLQEEEFILTVPFGSQGDDQGGDPDVTDD